MVSGVADNGCAGAVDVTPVIVPVIGFVLIVDVLVVVCAAATPAIITRRNAKAVRTADI